MKLIYLDQNGLSKLSLKQSGDLSAHFIGALLKNKFQMVIGFSHIAETAKASDIKRNRIALLFNTIHWQQVKPLVQIVQNEVKNEYYRFLNLSQRVDSNHIGPIFESRSENMTFEQLIAFARMNTSLATNIEKQMSDHDKRMAQLVSKTPKTNLIAERNGVLNFFINSILKNGKLAGLPFELPHRSLNANDFAEHFDWNRARFLDLYTRFQTFRYANQGRRPSGDLADSEHAIVGAVGCDYLMLEKNAADVLSQIERNGFQCKAKIFKTLENLLNEIG